MSATQQTDSDGKKVMKLAEIFHLASEHKEKIHPHALKRFAEWIDEIFREVPQLEKLTWGEFERHVDTYLTNDEKAKLAKRTAEIGEWLSKCAGIGQEYSPEPFSASIIWPMVDVKQLVKQVYERKDEEQRRQAALEALSPPLQSAKKYLSPEEYKEFEKSIPGAVSGYLARGEFYFLDNRATRYWLYIDTIHNRREKEERKRNAQSKAEKFNQALNEEIKRLKSVLYAKRQSPESYFKKQNKDPRYLGYSFAYLLPDDERRMCNGIVQNRQYETISREFSSFIFREYTINYFLLPSAEYSFEQVPCLDFGFDIFAVIEAKVWVKPNKVTIDGYVFTFPLIEHKTPYGSYFTELKEPEFLGYDYQLLTPFDLGGTYWQSIPLVLIRGLMDGELEPDGTVIIEASEGSTTYEVDGFEEIIAIPAGFANYLKEIGGIGQMANADIISKKVATIIEKRLTQPKTEPKTPLLLGNSAVGFEDQAFISSLTALGIPRRDAEKLLDVTPRNVTLSEATKLALQKYKETVA